VTDDPNIASPQPNEMPPAAGGDLGQGAPVASGEPGAPTAPGLESQPVVPEQGAGVSAEPPAASAADEVASGEAPSVPESASQASFVEEGSAVVSETPARADKAPAAAGARGRKLTPAEPATDSGAEVPKSDKMDWYILKVQSNREESIREGLRRRVAVAGLDHYFGDVIIPTEKVTEFKGGKRKVFKRKLYPGYLVVQMEINEETWFLVRETPGIGDFTGAAGHPTPMQAREVAAILAKQEEKTDEAPKLKISFRVGDHVKIKEGTFENFEGEVANIDETNGRVTVLINIFGRSTPVDIEYWQIEAV